MGHQGLDFPKAEFITSYVFFFSPSVVEFVCQSSVTSVSSQEDATRSLLQKIHKVSIGKASVFEAYERWRDFARDYSGRLCTKHTDRLPALAGVARLFANKMRIQDQYAVGLWRRDFIKGTFMATSQPGAKAPLIFGASKSFERSNRITLPHHGAGSIGVRFRGRPRIYDDFWAGLWIATKHRQVSC